MADKPKKRALSWSACKQAMHDWPRPGVISLIQELYELSAENRQYLHSRLITDKPDAVLAEFEQELRRKLKPTPVIKGAFSSKELTVVVDRYAKATDDPGGVAQLLLVDIDCCLNLMNELGDLDEVADHVLDVLDRLTETLERVPVEERAFLTRHLHHLAGQWGSSFGYGISDELVDLSNKFGKT